MSIGPNCRAKYQLRRRYGSFSTNGVFDWQVTPPGACVEYLRNGLVGLFEREDLEIRDGIVWNRRWNTSHQHEFPPKIDAAGLDKHYPSARSRHDHLCENFRRALRSKRVLLAFSGKISPETQAQLVAAAAAYGSRLHVVFEPQDDAPWPRWIGDDRLWNRLLAPYRLGFGPTLILLQERAVHLGRAATDRLKQRLQRSST